MRLSEEHLTGQVPPTFTAQGTWDHQGLEWKSLQASRDVTLAQLAGHHELLPFTDGEAEGHARSIGEGKENSQRWKSGGAGR
jgi:hypothetical protein